MKNLFWTILLKVTTKLIQKIWLSQILILKLNETSSNELEDIITPDHQTQKSEKSDSNYFSISSPTEKLSLSKLEEQELKKVENKFKSIETF